jgi:hypothetical protein
MHLDAVLMGEATIDKILERNWAVGIQDRVSRHRAYCMVLIAQTGVMLAPRVSYVRAG